MEHQRAAIQPEHARISSMPLNAKNSRASQNLFEKRGDLRLDSNAVNYFARVESTVRHTTISPVSHGQERRPVQWLKKPSVQMFRPGDRDVRVMQRLWSGPGPRQPRRLQDMPKLQWERDRDLPAVWRDREGLTP